MLPSTPSKKVLTDDKRGEIDASNAYRDRVLPEDLSIALQNLGTRVRKSVTEGYNTHSLTSVTVPATPYSSPAKFTSIQTTPTPIFRSANDAFDTVFPPGSLRVPLTPSPKKRRRTEEPFNDGESRRIWDSDVDMGAESEVEDDQVMVILGPDANSNVFSMPRKIKPLRRSMAQNRTGGAFLDLFSFISPEVGQRISSPDVAQSGGVDMDLSKETTD